MRFRKTNALVGALVAVGALFMVYLVIDTISVQYEEAELQKNELINLESKLSGLETDLFTNQKTIEKIRETVKELRNQQVIIKEESKSIRAKGKSPVNKTFASIAKVDLQFPSVKPSQCDIRMDDVYDKIQFKNIDGGVWKQGWEIQYDQAKVIKPENKLRVFVMPHSHNDPGWIKTFEEYYASQTRHILDNAVKKLTAHPKMKFVWAEISFLALWWVEQNADTRNKFIKLLENKQLEILTGGWVMNDEANTFYYAMVEQMMTGHEWCRKHLNNYKPNNGWAIDPFGMTPTMAYLLKRMGMDNMLIQRTHYEVKKYLAQTKDLEFKWRQHWDHDTSTEMLTHMMPFYSYDVPHTCGPDPKICCQFDFLRLPGAPRGISCPWRIPPKPITSSNVEERAYTLLDQYRKKAELYKTNTVLAPLGDDFRYDHIEEWDLQYDNYQAIFDYVNSHPELNAELSFGTLQDYFDEVRRKSKAISKSDDGLFKSLSGDFFTYCDREDNYWSGYYTSRPFYKNMDRILEGYLRAAELLYSMAWAEMEYVGTDFKDFAFQLFGHLTYARQNLALFQHHDGVTGTAKDHVMVDYGNKMLESIRRLQAIMSHTAHYLLTPSKAFYKPKLQEDWFDLDDFREHHNSLPQQTTIQIGHPEQPSKVVIFNSHGRHRSETVTVLVSDPNVRVYKINNIDGDDEEENIVSQISPVFTGDKNQISNSEYQLSFLAQVKGLSLMTYFVAAMSPEEGQNTDMDIANIRIHNSQDHPFQARPFEEPQVFESGEDFSIQNGYIRAHFDKDGFLQDLTTLDDKVKTDMKLEFIKYGTRRSGDKSGAYLFMPDGEASVIQVRSPLVRIIEGKVISYVEVHTQFAKHTVTLKSSPGPDGTGLQINNDVDIRQMNNIELAMRFSTDIDSGDEFFTDLNGFQMMKRKRRLDKLPIGAQYYPIPSMAYIQDHKSRLTLVSKQPLGGSSLKQGQLEIMMDRRLSQDDNRGLFQGVTDNQITPHTFYLVLERKYENCKSDEVDEVSYPTLLSLNIRHGLINPMYRLINHDQSTISGLSKTYEPVDKEISCDIDVVTIRTMEAKGLNVEPSNEAVLILHRQGFNGCYKPVGLTCSTNGGKISVEELLPELYSDQMKQASLTLLYEGVSVQKGFTVSIKPMEMYSFLLKR